LPVAMQNASHPNRLVHVSAHTDEHPPHFVKHWKDRLN
jgi:hypothetical protein